MAINEARFLMTASPTEDIEKLTDEEAMNERIREWLATPMGTVANDPEWGNNLSQFKHDPLSTGNGLDTQIELAIVSKMPNDIEDLQITGVSVEILDVDLFRLVVEHQYGATDNTVQMA